MVVIMVMLKLPCSLQIVGHLLSRSKPSGLKLASLIGINDLIENSYFIIGPISRFTRFLFQIIFLNWLSISSFVVFNNLQAKDYEQSTSLQISYFLS